MLAVCRDVWVDDLYRVAHMRTSGSTFLLAEYRTEAGRSIFISSVRSFNIVADGACRCWFKTEDYFTVSPKLHRSGAALAYIPNRYCGFSDSGWAGCYYSFLSHIRLCIFLQGLFWLASQTVTLMQSLSSSPFSWTCSKSSEEHFKAAHQPCSF